MALTVWQNVSPGDAVRSAAGPLVVDQVTEVPNQRLLVTGHNPVTGRQTSFYCLPLQAVPRTRRPTSMEG